MQIVVCKPLNTIKGYRPLGKAFSFIGGNADIFDDVILLPKLPEIWATEAGAYNRKSEVMVLLDFFFFSKSHVYNVNFSTHQCTLQKCKIRCIDNTVLVPVRHLPVDQG